MNMNLNRSAQAASEQFQALADQEKALVNNVLSAIKSAFSNEPDYSRSLQAVMDRGGEYSHRALAGIYRHPVAAVLSVLGAGCLFYGLRRSQSDDFDAYHQSRASYGVDPEYIDEWGEPIAAEADRAENKAKGALRDAKERVDELTPQARDYARNIGSRASQYAQEARTAARDGSRRLQGQSQDYVEQARSTIRQHPVAAGIIGVALGVAVGGAIYGSTRRKAPAYGVLSGKGISDRDLSRAAAFFNNSSNSAKEALLNARKRISH